MLLVCSLLVGNVQGQEFPELSEEQSAEAAENYQKYCALCHGDDRQGNANDHAPSLRSASLLSSGIPASYLAISYGRYGTPMEAYLDEVGGPLSAMDIQLLFIWLHHQSSGEVPSYTYSPNVVTGDVGLGKNIYAKECASCHGENGEGGTGTALGNSTMLALTEDGFLRYAIEHGRDGTEMPAFADKLSTEEIDSVTAFLRSRASGWTIDKPVLRTPPTADNYVLNSESAAPEFDLKDGHYVGSADLLKAIEEKKKMILLDTRATSGWQRMHIEGAIPVPYYRDSEELKTLAEDLPNDGTTIVVYCGCPRASADYVHRQLQELGFSNTAVLWEGIYGWVALGYPVSIGETVTADNAVLRLGLGGERDAH